MLEIRRFRKALFVFHSTISLSRQALIRRLRVLVPSVLLLAILSGVAAGLLGPRNLPLMLRSGGDLLLFAFLAVALTGTVPIIKDILTWNPNDPPEDWKRVLRRWERLDRIRAAAALLAFVFFAAAVFA